MNKTNKTEEGNMKYMKQLTRWLVKRYFPGYSLYKTRKTRTIKRVKNIEKGVANE